MNYSTTLQFTTNTMTLQTPENKCNRWSLNDATLLKCTQSAFGLTMTLTFDLCSWKSLQQWPLTSWIFVLSFVQIPPPST